MGVTFLESSLSQLIHDTQQLGKRAAYLANSVFATFLGSQNHVSALLRLLRIWCTRGRVTSWCHA